MRVKLKSAANGKSKRPSVSQLINNRVAPAVVVFGFAGKKFFGRKIMFIANIIVGRVCIEDLCGF